MIKPLQERGFFCCFAPRSTPTMFMPELSTRRRDIPPTARTDVNHPAGVAQHLLETVYILVPRADEWQTRDLVVPDQEIGRAHV